MFIVFFEHLLILYINKYNIHQINYIILACVYSDFILQLKKKFNLRIFIYNLVFLVSFLTIIYKFQNNLIIESKN